MPTYDYRCTSCRRVFEAHTAVSNRHVPQSCPHCKGMGDRLPSAPGIAFKGSGFYVNDYKDKP